MGNEVSQLHPNLYISGVLAARDAQKLRHIGITHVVSILPKAREIHDFIKYHKIEGIPDNREYAGRFQERFDNAFDFIHSALENGDKVLVHCLKGCSRSATLIITYLLTITDLNETFLLEKIKILRPKINPNPGFLTLLKNFDASRYKS